jgi:alpha-amylase
VSEGERSRRTRQEWKALDHNYTTYNIWPIYNHTNTIAFRKGFNGSQIVSVFTNTGSGTSSWTLNLDCEAAGWRSGTEVIEVISCTKHVISKDGYLHIKMQGGLPKVYFSTAAVSAGSGICNTYWGQEEDSGEDLTPSSTSKGYAAPSDTKRSAASAGVKGINGVKKKAAAVAGVLAYEVLNG